MRLLKSFTVLAVVLALALPAAAQDRAKAEEVVVAFAAEPRTLLPNTIVDWTTNNMLEHMYDRLVDRDPKTYKPIPMLATSWKVVDTTTWEFSLRSGVKFHNGEPFDAQSVKATMDYIKDPANKSHYAPRWTLVKDVQIVDSSTVRFITEKPWPGLIDRISLGDVLMMPPKALRTEGAKGLLAKPAGTGPFKFAEWVRDEKLVVVRNDDYWKGKPELKKVTFRFIPEFSARLAALMAGEIDIMKDVPPHAVDLVDRSGKATVRSTASSRINYLALVNLNPGPMQDIRSRQAISQAITVNVVVNEWGTHLDKIKNRKTGDMFFLGWGPALDAQNTIEQLFQGSMTYSSYGGNKALEDKIATAITIVDPKKRLDAWAEIQQMVASEVPWVFLWQQHDLYGVANWIDWQPRADEKVWMYEAKIVKR